MNQLPSDLLYRIEQSSLPPAVVVGTDVTGTTVARALARHGVPVIGVDDRIRSFTGYSRAYAHLHLVGDGFREAPIVHQLERLALELPRRAALLLSMDHHVTAIGRHGQHLKDRFAFEFPSADSVELLMDKQRFAEFAGKRGWPAPRTFTCNTPEEVAEASRNAAFPVLLKPRVKTPVFAAKSPRKVYRCDSPSDLAEVYRLVSAWEAGVIVQEWIPGGDDEVYFSFHYLARDGSEIGAFEGRKLRQYPPECGNTTAAVPVAEPRLHDTSLSVLQYAGAVGFCAVEYKRDPRTDTFFITEPTIGRVNLQIGTAIANGVNLPVQGYRHLMGLPQIREARPRTRRTWVHMRNDFRSARHHIARGQLTWGSYAASLLGPKAFAVWHPSEYRMALALIPHHSRRVKRFGEKVLSRVGPPAHRIHPVVRRLWPLIPIAGLASAFY